MLSFSDTSHVRAREAHLVKRLPDARSRKVVLVSHCLLNENARYLGGAFHSGAVPEARRLLDTGVGIHQMPCPERCAWGGVLKSYMLIAYGLNDGPLRRARRPLYWAFRRWTILRYRLLARRVARDIADYRRAGIAVCGVIGVGASPSCGVQTTLDMRRSFDAAASCPLATISPEMVNGKVVRDCRVAGEGLFIAALERRLARRGIAVPFTEHDLIAEMADAEARIRTATMSP